MEELIFFGIIIALSIVDSIARTVKARRNAGRTAEESRPESRPPRAAYEPGARSVPGTLAGRSTPTARREGPSYQPVPTHDAKPTYDDDPTYDSGPTSHSASTYDDATYESSWAPGEAATYDDLPTADARAAGEGAGDRSSAAGMIPQDLWEELAGLARGGTTPARVDPKPPPRPRGSVGVPGPAPVARPEATKPSAAPSPAMHVIHLTHAEYGTDPSGRVAFKGSVLQRTTRPNADVRAVRGQLAGGLHAMRQAVMLEEVLGPPASLRPPRFEEGAEG